MTEHTKLKEAYERAASNLMAGTPEEIQEATEWQQKCDLAWHPEDWDGMTEEEAFEEDPVGVMNALGEHIASRTWRCGSWSDVYEYRGRSYAIDEVEMCDFDNLDDAMERANIIGEIDEEQHLW